MATYAIGDVQGCFDALQRLLTHIRFNEDSDSLWFCGDLVNRGPQSLAVLQWVYDRRAQIKAVLGNHDLHLLALSHGAAQLKKGDTLEDILRSPMRTALLDYLQQLPLYHQHDHWLLVHAGVPPYWTVERLMVEADFAQSLWRKAPEIFFTQMYGNEPSLWQDNLLEMDRVRFCVNALTRMRYVNLAGELDLQQKCAPGAQAQGLLPWFEHPALLLGQNRVIFGHWASLMGKSTQPNAYALDTGCVWGQRLTAMRLEDCEQFSVSG